MPGFYLGHNFDGFNKHAIEQRQKQYFQFVTPILKKFPDKLLQLANNKEDFFYALKLRDYLLKIHQENYHEDRFKYIDDLMDAILANDITRQHSLLEEDNIKSFKGFLSQRLYDLLTQRREFLSTQASVSPKTN